MADISIFEMFQNKNFKTFHFFISHELVVLQTIAFESKPGAAEALRAGGEW